MDNDCTAVKIMPKETEVASNEDASRVTAELHT
eukprot:CAMPEP_0204375902 /NCGR_PEP_ID=MMETSP0469-20131031/49632_1 /ASSEMBLY_ACC=CAM_ASM_000384 /TAXON_ID=2969 /ORGANISM="Oxyrrhis marina" /LENGTH=32 /DNA_ID= /DNA_START= /DNA_END= /DNA_ORIENTATION=